MTTLHLDGTRQQELGHAVGIAAAIDAARRLGILARLDQEPADTATTARCCDTAPDTTGLLLDALHASGVLARDPAGRYSVTTDGRWGATLAGDWTHLSDVVRTGTPVVAADTPAGASEVYPDVVDELFRLLAPAAAEAARVLAPAGKVLDVGAGAAPWSIALARTDAGCQVTALDVPGVLARTRTAVAGAGLTDRFDYVAADMFDVELPEAFYDLILLGNVCHLFDPDTNRRLLARLRPALRPGGRLAILDALPSEDPDQHRQLSHYALSLRLRTQAGAVHPLPDYRTWTTAAGYGQLTTVQVSTQPPLTLLTAPAVPMCRPSEPAVVPASHPQWRDGRESR